MYLWPTSSLLGSSLTLPQPSSVLSRWASRSGSSLRRLLHASISARVRASVRASFHASVRSVHSSVLSVRIVHPSVCASIHVHEPCACVRSCRPRLGVFVSQLSHLPQQLLVAPNHCLFLRGWCVYMFDDVLHSYIFGERSWISKARDATSTRAHEHTHQRLPRTQICMGARMCAHR